MLPGVHRHLPLPSPDPPADEVLPVDFGTPRAALAPVAVEFSDLRAFLMQPGQREGPVQCYILREKGGPRMQSRWGGLRLGLV